MSLELPLLIGPRHTLGAFVLMRGETLLETIEPGMAAVFCLLSGGASISRPRAGATASLHIHAQPGQPGQPVVLSDPGVYCIIAKQHTIGARAVRLKKG